MSTDVVLKLEKLSFVKSVRKCIRNFQNYKVEKFFILIWQQCNVI